MPSRSSVRSQIQLNLTADPESNPRPDSAAGCACQIEQFQRRDMRMPTLQRTDGRHGGVVLAAAITGGTAETLTRDAAAHAQQPAAAGARHRGPRRPPTPGGFPRVPTLPFPDAPRKV